MIEYKINTMTTATVAVAAGEREKQMHLLKPLRMGEWVSGIGTILTGK